MIRFGFAAASLRNLHFLRDLNFFYFFPLLQKEVPEGKKDPFSVSDRCCSEPADFLLNIYFLLGILIYKYLIFCCCWSWEGRERGKGGKNRLEVLMEGMMMS